MTLLAYTDKPLEIVEWDVRETYQDYYPANGVLDPNPEPAPPEDFLRYRSPEPIQLRINTVVPNESYSLVLDQTQNRGWELPPVKLIYLPHSNSMHGVHDDYAVSLCEGTQAGGSIEFSFIFQVDPADPNSTLLIGHVRI